MAPDSHMMRRWGVSVNLHAALATWQGRACALWQGGITA